MLFDWLLPQADIERNEVEVCLIRAEDLDRSHAQVCLGQLNMVSKNSSRACRCKGLPDWGRTFVSSTFSAWAGCRGGLFLLRHPKSETGKARGVMNISSKFRGLIHLSLPIFVLIKIDFAVIVASWAVEAATETQWVITKLRDAGPYWAG